MMSATTILTGASLAIGFGLALAIADPLSSSPITGRAIAIDGDTIRMPSTGARMRLWGVDAPEASQHCHGALTGPYACGRTATGILRHMLARDPIVTCEPRGESYGRIVAVCRNSEGDLGARMVATGWAVDVPRYSGGAYRDHEAAAKAEGRGMHSGWFDTPEQWRRKHK